MKKTCSDRIFDMKRRLWEEERDLKERINLFYSKKREVLEEIAQEKLDDPSEELFRVEEEAKSCDPFAGFKVNDTETNKLCKYFSKGFCKKDSSCTYSHEILDCNEHVNNGICHRN